MVRPELVEVVLEQMGPLAPVPRQPLNTRLDEASGILFVSFPDPGRELKRHVLNPTAAAVYRLLDGTRSIAEIIELLSGRFPDVPVTDVARDIVFAVRTMERKGMIEPLRQTAHVSPAQEQ